MVGRGSRLTASRFDLDTLKSGSPFTIVCCDVCGDVSGEVSRRERDDFLDNLWGQKRRRWTGGPLTAIRVDNGFINGLVRAMTRFSAGRSPVGT